MSLPTPTVQFPEAHVGEWTAIDTRTAPGLFAYRQTQAVALLDLPDYGGGDLEKLVILSPVRANYRDGPAFLGLFPVF